MWGIELGFLKLNLGNMWGIELEFIGNKLENYAENRTRVPWR